MQPTTEANKKTSEPINFVVFIWESFSNLLANTITLIRSCNATFLLGNKARHGTTPFVGRRYVRCTGAFTFC